MWLKDIFFGRSLASALDQTKVIKAAGVKFKVRRLQVLDHMAGLNVLIEQYATYERKRELEKRGLEKPSPQEQEKILARVKEVYRDVFLATVIWPKLCSKEDEEGQFVDDLFDDWDLCHALYQEIMLFTNKKKVKKHLSLVQNY